MRQILLPSHTGRSSRRGMLCSARGTDGRDEVVVESGGEKPAGVKKTRQSPTVCSVVSQHTVGTGSPLNPVRQVSRTPFSNGPFFSHQQPRISRWYFENFIDIVAAEVDPIDAVGELANQPHPHDCGWKAIWIPRRDSAEL